MNKISGKKDDQEPVPRWMKNAKVRGQAMREMAERIREEEDLRRNGIRRFDRRMGDFPRTTPRS